MASVAAFSVVPPAGALPTRPNWGAARAARAAAATTTTAQTATATHWLSFDEETLQYTGSADGLPTPLPRATIGRPAGWGAAAWSDSVNDSASESEAAAAAGGKGQVGAGSPEKPKGGSNRRPRLLVFGGFFLGALLVAGAAGRWLQDGRGQLQQVPASGWPEQQPQQEQQEEQKEQKQEKKQKQKPVLTLQLQKPARTKPRMKLDHIPKTPSFEERFPYIGWVLRGDELPVQLDYDAESITLYEQNFAEALQSVEQRWEKATKVTRRAFSRHFLPTVGGGFIVPAPVALFQRHSEALRLIVRPRESDNTRLKQVYAFRVQLLAAVCTNASARLDALSRLEQFCHASGVGSQLLGIRTFPLAAEEAAAAAGGAPGEGSVSFKEFVSLLGGRLVALKERDEDESNAPRVSRELAVRLANVLQREDMMAAQALESVQIFRYFLNELGEEFAFPEAADPAAAAAAFGSRFGREDPGKRLSVPFSPGQRPFHLGAFMKAVSLHDAWARECVISAEAVAAWGEQWTDKAVEQLLRSLERKDQQRIQERQALKQEAENLADCLESAAGVPLHDLYTLAVALL
ncbi:hypothetical protein, conserved [Eimeria acervulina]|uniref:Uncharacterized protein n=1 Tax=Eimeria acervulina TaxID=5801 RepID=U6GFU9_EIMAC|nr:hypothetical protein, conserved [Eimeria acervulina]CDI78457.1 hypothetical protein, conserved [Eimeria acervulina]